MTKNITALFIGVLLASFQLSGQVYTKEVLIGKGNPVFYGKNYKLQKEAHNAFLLMQKAAMKEGIEIKVVSSYRSFEHQKRIWTRKYKRFTEQGLSPEKTINKIIEYSTIPGTSRHHWGTDIDLVDGSVTQPASVLDPTNFEEGAVFDKFKNWMDANANTFGFYLVYTNEIGRKGFKYEPWHFSYKSISKKMLAAYNGVDIKQILQNENLLGSSFFNNEFIEKYRNENVFDINSELK